MPAIGYVTRQEDGSFKGQLRTLSIRADIEIVPNRTKNTESQPDYDLQRPLSDGARQRRATRSCRRLGDPARDAQAGVLQTRGQHAAAR
jgi:uncharacterized protein (DUF736 family)